MTDLVKNVIKAVRDDIYAESYIPAGESTLEAMNRMQRTMRAAANTLKALYEEEEVDK
jgi:hypothetical protein